MGRHVESGYGETEQPPTLPIQVLRDNRKKGANCKGTILHPVGTISTNFFKKDRKKRHGTLSSKSSLLIRSKVLRTLHKDFQLVIAAIEESKDLLAYAFDELTCSPITHEQRIRSYDDKVKEKAFKAKGILP
ncbi:unnamed protein product [Amaranthus hypochondriacus]